jgi:hypothetical protein
MIACMYGRVEVVRLLLSHREIDINVKGTVRNDEWFLLLSYS